MKAQTFNLISHEVKANCIHFIHQLQADGKLKVSISGIGTKSDRQRALDWRWDDEILKSGIGHDDSTTEMVHARNKWLFARPILLRDDELFRSIFQHFVKTYGNDSESCIRFAKDWISTEKMTVSQVSEYMTNKQRYWLQAGVELTNPDDYGIEFK